MMIDRQRQLAAFLCRAIGRENVRIEEHEARGVRAFIWDGRQKHVIWLNGINREG
jgi:hypothetical protein